MPSYDYECRSCGYRFEAFQSMADAPLTTCPQCGKLQVRRLITGGTGIIFKGSGFYVTDHRSSGKAGSAGHPSKPAAASDGAPKESAPADAAPKEQPGKDGAKVKAPA